MWIEMQNLDSSESIDVDDEEEMATLEQLEHCLNVCGFGKYQWCMLSISFLGVLAHVSVMLSTPYAFLVGDSKKYNKEILSLIFLIPYLGMLVSSIIFGFISDCFGRKRVIIVCYAGLVMATLMEIASRHYKYLVVAKFCVGFFLSGAFVASTTLQAEFQTETSRDRIMVTLNFFVAINNILITLPAFFVAPFILNISEILDLLDLDIWDICTVFNVVYCLTVCLIYVRMPESPKSDFVHGRYKNALDTLKSIYSMNTGKSRDEFPYQLLGMTENVLKSHKEQVRTTWAKVKHHFKKPLLQILIIIMVAQITFTFGYNTMRMWHPTVVAVIDKSPSNSTPHLCAAFENHDRVLTINILTAVLYHMANCVMILMFGIIPYIVVTIVINNRKKLLLIIILCICCCCIISMHWIKTSSESFIAFGVFMAFGQLFIGLIQAIAIDLFPVWTKSLGLSLALTASAIGAVLAELLFSTLEQYGCALAFIVAATIACAASVSVLLPK